MRKFKKRKDNETFEIPNNGIHFIACCDCGLAHKMAVAIEENGNIGVAFERNENLTASCRRDIRKHKGMRLIGKCKNCKNFGIRKCHWNHIHNVDIIIKGCWHWREK